MSPNAAWGVIGRAVLNGIVCFSYLRYIYVWVCLSPSSLSGEHAVIALRLAAFLLVFVTSRNLGDVTGADGTYDLTRPGDPAETALVPDVAFVQAGRLPARNPGYGKLAPDLVAEVASPSRYRPEMADKAKLYLDRGVRLVWVLWPNRQEADVWWPASPQAPMATLGIADSLDGYDVVPGFTCPLADLFK